MDAAGAAVTLTCPVIPGINDRPEHFRAIAELANGLAHVAALVLQPYHAMGDAKRARLGLSPEAFQCTAPAPETLAGWLSLLKSLTAVPVALR